MLESIPGKSSDTVAAAFPRKEFEGQSTKSCCQLIISHNHIQSTKSCCQLSVPAHHFPWSVSLLSWHSILTCSTSMSTSPLLLSYHYIPLLFNYLLSTYPTYLVLLKGIFSISGYYESLILSDYLYSPDI